MSLDADYPLALAITVAGALTGAAVECRTHRFARVAVEGGVRRDLAPRSRLDRDVVILVAPREPRPSLVVRARDAVSQTAPVVVTAAFQPPASARHERIALKLLVDCSGSMAGDSIASARAALRGVLDGLGEHDQISLSRFGSQFEQLQTLASCAPRTLRRVRQRMEAIDADMGGTEMQTALVKVFELAAPKGQAAADVLLINDGQIWQAQALVDAAKASAHRVFVIGVGTAPAEGVLRSLAEATGGACEFATPGEALEAAARRMLGRIRQQPLRGLRIDWGGEPLWQSVLPAGAFGGDTVIAFAGMAPCAPASSVRLPAAEGSGAASELARGEADSPCPRDTLSRIAAAQRIGTSDANAALSLAVDYQLMSPQTNCILVHERAEADVAAGMPELHRLGSMLAAGWGATGSAALGACHDYSNLSTPSVWRNSTRAAAALDPLCTFMHEPTEIPAFLRRQDAQPIERDPASLEKIALAVADHLTRGGQLQDLAACCEALMLHPDVRLAIEQAVGLGTGDGHAWLVLAHWTNKRMGGPASCWLTTTLQPDIDRMEADRVERCLKLFDQLLGTHPLIGGDASRTSRPHQARTRAVR